MRRRKRQRLVERYKRLNRTDGRRLECLIHQMRYSRPLLPPENFVIRLAVTATKEIRRMISDAFTEEAGNWLKRNKTLTTLSGSCEMVASSCTSGDRSSGMYRARDRRSNDVGTFSFKLNSSHSLRFCLILSSDTPNAFIPRALHACCSSQTVRLSTPSFKMSLSSAFKLRSLIRNCQRRNA